MPLLTSRIRLLFVLTVVAGTALRLWLAYRQRRHVLAHGTRVPAKFDRQVSLAEHQRATHYTAAKASVEQVEALWNAAWILLATVGGGLNLLDRWWRAAGIADPARGVLFLLSLSVLAALVSMPFDIYRIFVLETRFDFNRSPVRLFLADTLKQLAISLLLVTAGAYTVLWLMSVAPRSWWLVMAILLSAFQLALAWLYPVVIAPWFNRFDPIPDENVRSRIQKLLDRNGLGSDGVFIMDGSRRSTHGNAYVTGMGRRKRIVFFDTLLKQLTPGEIEAVLAHEIGHVKKHHLARRLAAGNTFVLGALFLLAWLGHRPWFYAGLGITHPSPYAALALFLVALPPFMLFLRPLAMFVSRHHEYEADMFAARETGSVLLAQALVRLYRDNAAPLSVDRWYAGFYYSHPPALMRIQRLGHLMP
ncbi:MAG: M48 family metallopeptidase [Acidiferrobacteraceae bacterium]